MPINHVTTFSVVRLAVVWFTVFTFAVCYSDDFAGAQDQRLILVQGTGGQEQYDELFRQWSEQWKAAAAHTELVPIGGRERSTESENSKTVRLNY